MKKLKCCPWTSWQTMAQETAKIANLLSCLSSTLPLPLLLALDPGSSAGSREDSAAMMRTACFAAIACAAAAAPCRFARFCFFLFFNFISFSPGFCCIHFHFTQMSACGRCFSWPGRRQPRRGAPRSHSCIPCRTLTLFCSCRPSARQRLQTVWERSRKCESGVAK